MAVNSLDGAFSILSFGDLCEPDLAYVEQALGSLQVEKESEVALATLAFDRLWSSALNPADSVELLGEVLDRY